jgi:mannose-6-phosphate isomerase class I
METIRSAIATVTGGQPETKNVFRLRGSIQDYEWGKSGSTSLVAKLASESVGPDYKIDPNHTYAEVHALMLL